MRVDEEPEDERPLRAGEEVKPESNGLALDPYADDTLFELARARVPRWLLATVIILMIIVVALVLATRDSVRVDSVKLLQFKLGSENCPNTLARFSRDTWRMQLHSSQGAKLPGGFIVSESSSVRANLFSTASVGSQRLTVALFTVAAFLYWVALYLYVPTLPTYVQSKTHDLALVGTVLSMYGLWQAFVRLPLGITVDWLGWRKPFIIIGLGLVGLGAWTMGTTGSVNGLTIGRAITGLAAGTWVLLVVGFTSLFPPQEVVRASATLTLCSSIARMVGTSVTGSLNEVGGYSLAFFLATGVAALAILMMLFIPEQRRPPKQPSVGSVGLSDHPARCAVASSSRRRRPVCRLGDHLWLYAGAGQATGRNGCHAEHPGDAEPRHARTGEPGDVLRCQPSRRAALGVL